MLLTRLPPHFLLPAWTPLQLSHILKRAYRSNNRFSEDRPRRSKGARSLFDSKQKQSADSEPVSRPLKRQPTPKQPGPSLFDELFREEKENRRNIQRDRELEKLPAFDWVDEAEQRPVRPERREERLNDHRFPGLRPDLHHPFRIARYDPSPDQDVSVLVLQCLSKTLEQSDFYRLSPKGEHIEGWTSGITNIIPGRDNQTLESKGHYFLLFSSDAAASAYIDQIMRIHQLSITHSTHNSIIAPPPGYLKDGEDIHALINGFSLIPSHNKISFRILKRPYSPAVQALINNGGPAIITTRESKAEDMVLLSIDGGRVSSTDLRAMIDSDRKRRNQLWRLAGNGEIVSLEADEDRGVGRDRDKRPRARNYSGSKARKFILSFVDRHEARRFVRDWHRRPFPPELISSVDGLGGEMPIVNAEIMW